MYIKNTQHIQTIKQYNTHKQKKTKTDKKQQQQ